MNISNLEEGDTLEIVGPASKDSLWTVDYGDYGSVSMTIPPRGSFRVKIGTIAPTIIINDVETDIPDGDNVIRIENPD